MLGFVSGDREAYHFLADQFGAMMDELNRRRDECIQLRTLLATRSRGVAHIANESYGGDPNILNEDGELEMAYKTQKDLNKWVTIAAGHVTNCLNEN